MQFSTTGETMRVRRGPKTTSPYTWRCSAASSVIYDVENGPSDYVSAQALCCQLGYTVTHFTEQTKKKNASCVSQIITILKKKFPKFDLISSFFDGVATKIDKIESIYFLICAIL